MKKKFLILFLCIWAFLNINAQDYSDYFTTYKPVYTPPKPVYITPMPSIYDNSVTIIDNSYRPSTPSVTCTDSQKQTGQILMVDTTNDNNSVIDAEVLFKSFSNNTASITITRLKLDGKWYPVNIEAFKLSAALENSGSDRDLILELLKSFNFFASSEEVIFLF